MRDPNAKTQTNHLLIEEMKERQVFKAAKKNELGYDILEKLAIARRALIDVRQLISNIDSTEEIIGLLDKAIDDTEQTEHCKD